jgi:hypothetical protein
MLSAMRLTQLSDIVTFFQVIRERSTCIWGNSCDFNVQTAASLLTTFPVNELLPRHKFNDQLNWQGAHIVRIRI